MSPLIESLALDIYKKSKAHIIALILIRRGSPVMVVHEDHSVVGQPFYRKRLASLLRELAAKLEADSEERKEK